MIKVNTATLEATREAIPKALKGLTAETLRNLQTELNPVPADYADMEFWPEVDVSPTLTETQKYGDETLTAVVADKQVERSQAVVDKTAEELQAEADAAKAAAVQQALSDFLEEVSVIQGGYTQAEIDTFPTQEAEAAAWTADNTAPTPLLDAIISESGEAKAELVTKILGNAAAMKAAIGKAIGTKQREEKAAGA